MRQSRYWVAVLICMLIAACSSGGGGGDNGGDGSNGGNNILSFTSDVTASVPENTTEIGYTATVEGTGVEGELTLSISGGSDASLFEIDPDSGELTFTTPPDFENPSDSDGGNDYEVEIQVEDGSGASAVLSVTIFVTDVIEGGISGNELSFTSGTTAIAPEEQRSTGYTAEARDPDGNAITYRLVGGADQSAFSIDPASGILTFDSAPDFENPSDSNSDNDYVVEIEATNGQGDRVVQTVTVTVSGINEPHAFISGDSSTVPEEQTSTDYIAEASDPEGDTITFGLAGGADQSAFSIGAETGILIFTEAPDHENPTDSNLDNDYVVDIEAVDSSGSSVIQTVTVSVEDIADHTNADLRDLSIDPGMLDQIFQPNQTSYSATVRFLTASVDVIATADDVDASIMVDGATVDSGVPHRVDLAEGENAIEVEVTAEDGATTRSYELDVTRQTVDQLAQQAYVKASNTEAKDEFGGSIVLSGDTLAVGARFEDSDATGVSSDGSGEGDNGAFASGAVYVFTRDGDGLWSQQAYLKASNTEDGDGFGDSLALSGNTLAVGARFEDSDATGVSTDGSGEADNSASASGAVYVFTRDGDGLWSQQAYVKASNTQAGDSFGFSVALSGDTLAVGAHFENSSTRGVSTDGSGEADNSASAAGAVYVFTRDDSDLWSQQAYVKASNAEANDQFGFSVALAGDTLAVGARREDSDATGTSDDGSGEADNSASDSGAVYVFSRDGDGLWSQQAYVKASNTGSGDEFGGIVALSGDTLAVGARFEDSDATGVSADGSGAADNSASDSGAVYVFTRDDSDLWSQQAYVKASNAEANDQFGVGVALSGDTLAVGARFEDSNATGASSDGSGETDNSAPASGAVYAFTRDNSDLWSQQAYVKASNSEAGDGFGHSVMVDGDSLAVSAVDEDSEATGVSIDGSGEGDNAADSAGAVYIRR